MSLKPSAADDTSILVFPADRTYWAEPVAASRRFKSVGAAHNGTFTLTPLPAGEYLVAAISDVDARGDQWQEPRRLEALAQTAVRVTLGDGDHKTIEVKR